MAQLGNSGIQTQQYLIMLIYCRKIKMTKEKQVSESEVKRDAKLDSFENLISRIKQDLVTRLCESAETGAEALVRREERQLEVRGDFSLPSLTSKTWDRHRLRDNASPSSLLSSNCSNTQHSPASHTAHSDLGLGLEK